MKLATSLFFLFSSSLLACDFVAKEVVIFSGPITHLAQEIGLLNSKKIKAISAYAEVETPKHVEIVEGGLFLSPLFFKKFLKAQFFIDQSVEQARILKKLKISFFEIKSRGQDPFLTTYENIRLLKENTVSCEDDLDKLKLKLQKEEEALKKTKLNVEDRVFVFYLGEISSNNKKPSQAMRDGFILWLEKYKNIKTYPGPLFYVPWSEKWIKEQEAKGPVWHIGLSSVNTGHFRQALGNNHFNFKHKHLLTPGLPQVKLLANIIKNLN